jgi:hypothetical protein
MMTPVRITTAALLACLLLYCRAGAARVDTDDPVFKQIDGIVQTLSDMTGMKEEHAVPFGRMSQPELRKFLAHRLKTTLKPKELYADELTLKLFGLVPADFDLKKSTVDLLTEQAAAFYDYREKRLFLLDVSSFASEETTLAHELAHALADQHFNLEKFVDSDSEDDDENLAHSAVVEGQASWLMLAFQRKREGMPGTPSTDQLATVLQSAESASPSYPVLDASPLYIQQSLLFPYTEGTRFFNAVYNKLGKSAFRDVFVDPPTDTAQIYHPELYFSRVKPVRPELPRPQFKGGETEIAAGSLGEFDHRMLIWQFNGKSKALALSPHARGGEYRIVGTGRKHKQTVLEYASVWDSGAAASDYLAAYKQVLRKKWKTCDATVDTPDLFSGTGDAGFFVVRRTGQMVTSIEGISRQADWERIAAAR